MDALNAVSSTPSMRARWSDDAILRAMLRFEVALAEAQADAGLIPAASARLISSAAESLHPEPLALAQEAQRAGTLAIPLVKQLRAAVAKRDPAAAHHVHLGATSQDVADTALILQSVASLDSLLGELVATGDALAALARAHTDTPLLGRTLMQPAAPITFGWKVAGWLDALGRCVQALRRVRTEVAVVQFGGANGILQAHGSAGTKVATRLADRLNLRVPAIAWHGARDRLARLASELAITCGVLGKFGRDISLLMQLEVGEAFEPSGEGRGGSSAMPHKRNPVAAMHLLDSAYRAPALAQILLGELPAEHERGLGSWPNALPTLDTLFGLVANSTLAARECAEGLQVDPAAMQANIDKLHGVVYSEPLAALLATLLGPAAAQALVAKASATALRQQRSILDVLLDDDEVANRIDRSELQAACTGPTQLAGAHAMQQAVLDAWQAQRASRTGT